MSTYLLHILFLYKKLLQIKGPYIRKLVVKLQLFLFKMALFLCLLIFWLKRAWNKISVSNICRAHYFFIKFGYKYQLLTEKWIIPTLINKLFYTFINSKTLFFYKIISQNLNKLLNHSLFCFGNKHVHQFGSFKNQCRLNCLDAMTCQNYVL